MRNCGDGAHDGGSAAALLVERNNSLMYDNELAATVLAEELARASSPQPVVRQQAAIVAGVYGVIAGLVVALCTVFFGARMFGLELSEAVWVSDSGARAVDLGVVVFVVFAAATGAVVTTIYSLVKLAPDSDRSVQLSVSRDEVSSAIQRAAARLGR